MNLGEGAGMGPSRSTGAGTTQEAEEPQDE
jgi:hypothetical protein